MLHIILIISNIVDVGIPETPSPLESANVGNLDPPLKITDVLYVWPHNNDLSSMQYYVFAVCTTI